MPRTPPARPESSRTSPRTNSVRPPTRSRRHVLRTGGRGRRRRTTRVPLATRPAPGGDPRARTRRPAVAERHLLVGVRLLSAASRREHQRLADRRGDELTCELCLFSTMWAHSWRRRAYSGCDGRVRCLASAVRARLPQEGLMDLLRIEGSRAALLAVRELPELHVVGSSAI